MNSFGRNIRFTTFGESHGEMIGGVLDGLPSGFRIDFDIVEHWINRRKPADVYGGTSRLEPDKVQFVSGLVDGVTTGTPLAYVIQNKNVNSGDYKSIENFNRPSHADAVYRNKYGIYDYKGGGRASARETLVRVVAGSIASQMLKSRNIEFQTWIKQIGTIQTPFESSIWLNNDKYKLFPDHASKKLMISKIEELKQNHDSIGGIVACNIRGVPSGLGEPVYDKLSSRLAAAMFSINAVKGFEIGAGFKASVMQGSAYNDQPVNVEGKIEFLTNNDGGIQAGISNGNLISFTVAFKPPASIGLTQNAVNTQGNVQQLTIAGRHDSCIVPRAAVVVEAMAAWVILDFYLQTGINRWANMQ